METYKYFLLIIGGFIAGIINTLAGNGSAVTLTLMLMFGLPPHIANGSNRIGGFLQTLTAYFSFRKADDFAALQKESSLLLIPTVIGSILGALIAVDIDEALLNRSIGWFMVFMLFIVLSQPKKWLRTDRIIKQKNKVLQIILFFFIGLYAGFIQMGMGILFLAALVLGTGYTVVQANIIKTIFCLLLIIPAMFIFIYNQQVNWTCGLLLALGQSAGALVASKYAMKNENVAIWVRRLLIFMISIAIVKIFRLYSFIY